MPDAGVRERADGWCKRRPLLIFPCNGNGVEALDCLGDAFFCAGFVDDDPEKQKTQPHGFKVFPRAILSDLGESQVLAVPGSPSSFRSRRRIVDSLGLEDAKFARVIHPISRISSLATIGFNVLIMAGVVITSNCVIGNHVCILPNTVIHHDVSIGDWTVVGSNVTVAGNTAIGDNCYIGSGTSIMNGLRVADESMIGLGSNVINDVAPGATVAGNPARPIR